MYIDSSKHAARTPIIKALYDYCKQSIIPCTLAEARLYVNGNIPLPDELLEALQDPFDTFLRDFDLALAPESIKILQRARSEAILEAERAAKRLHAELENIARLDAKLSLLTRSSLQQD